MHQPVSVKPLPGYRIQLRYADGVQGEVDLSHLAGKGVFSLWDKRAAFNSVKIGAHGELRWSDDVELCADALYLEITGKQPEDIYPNLKASADA